MVQEASNSQSDLLIQEFEEDTCYETNDIHSTKYRLLDEKKVAEDQHYILHISGTTDTNFNLAVGTSENTCEVYHFDNNHLAQTDVLKQHSENIVGVQFSPENNSLLYTASKDGNINLWDLRLSEKLVAQFCDKTIENNPEVRTITSFDIAPNNRLLAAGTELYEGEAFILFWDVRNVNLLGGYWESHTDDITQVKFHPNDINMLASGSTDGLINIYDLKETSEDDALLDSLNTESSIEQLLWYRHKGKDCISCITHTVDVQLWKTDDVEPYAHFRRPDVTIAIKRTLESHCYIAGAHKLINDELVILAGSNWNNGEYVKAVCTDNSKLVSKFTLKENSQRIRSSWYNQHHNVLVTGGERGILNVWHVDFLT